MNILVAIAVSLVSFVGLVKFVPLSWLDTQPRTFGTTITTIQGSDTLSSSRTTINNNFSALNTGKFELSDWYATTSARQLTTIGIQNSTTGAVTVAYGGTGSTTLSSNQLLLGNGTGNIGVVSGWGTSGYALVSNGSGNAPTWQSLTVDTTANFNFTGTYFGVKNLNASSTVQIGGVSLVFPSSQGTASSTLMNDGSGNLKWAPTPGLFYVNTSATSPSTNASTTIFSTTIPANVLFGNYGVRFTVYFTAYQLSNTNNTVFDFAYGTASTTFKVNNGSGSSIGPSSGKLEFIVMANGATNSQVSHGSIFAGAGNAGTGGNSAINGSSNSSAIDATQARTLMLVFRTDNGVIAFTPTMVVGEYIR